MPSIDLYSIAKWLEPLAWIAGLIIAGLVAGLLVHLVIWQSVRRISKKTRTILDDSFYRRWRRPTRYVFVILAIYILLPVVAGNLPQDFIGATDAILVALLIATIAWSLVKLAYILEEAVLDYFRMDVKDNLRARQVHTQVRIIRRFAVALTVIVAVAVLFMSYEQFRELGMGILASAGIAGIIIGLAAQRTLGSLLAGIQIAITQPIRLDDVVIVEGEWGRIEEITLTYVVIRIWDLRRLIVPINYFLEKPYQNWTRVSADILGTVFIYTDYTVPIDAIRKKLTRILHDTEDWDGKVDVLQVTNANERTVEVRALMSAADSSTAWNLRCHVREELIKFFQENYPDSLPKTRVALAGSPGAASDHQKA